MRTSYLQGEDIVLLSGYACDGIPPLVRDASLVACAAFRPTAGHHGQEVYPDLFEKAAALLHSLAFERGFRGCNERVAWLACITFLHLNGVPLRPDAEVVVPLLASVSSGETDDVKVVADVLRRLREDV